MMKTAQHTPGPVVRWQGLDAKGHVVVCSTGKASAVRTAAPDLLQALKTWMRFFDEMPKGQFGKISCDIGLMNDGFIQSKRAIAKATGQGGA
jgi:hypothetical protein